MRVLLSGLTLVIATLTIISIDSIVMNVVLASTSNQTQEDSEPVIIAACGGNGTAPLTAYIPDNMEIKVGQTVTWHNLTTVGEPHSVTFIFDANKIAGVVSPLGVSNTTEFTALPPGSNN